MKQHKDATASTKLEPNVVKKPFVREGKKLTYMIFYNILMNVGFMYIFVTLIINFINNGLSFIPISYQKVGFFLKIMQTLQCVEIIHPLLGLVKGGPLMPFLQIGGRMFILYMMVDWEPKIHPQPVVFVLIFVWSLIENIRYPYYFLQLFNTEIAFLSWLRYNAWIICYPIGWTCEMIICCKNVTMIEESGKWSMQMPNPINFSLDFALALKIYIYFVTTPGIVVLLAHMYKNRKVKLYGEKSKEKLK